MMKPYVVLVGAGGALPLQSALCTLLREAKTVVCADGGVDWVLAQGISPAWVLGDLDSTQQASFNVPVRVFPRRKDQTDLELALDVLLEEIPDAWDLVILGAIGTRLDHTFANFDLLPRYQKRKGRIVLRSAYHTIQFFYPGRYVYRYQCESEDGDHHYISLLAYTADTRISLQGFDYDLQHVRLDRHSTLGISNHLLRCEGIIEVHEGGVWCIEAVENAEREILL